MDKELEDQIDEIIVKATKDLKTRIARVVIRHQTKLLKDQARDIKSGGAPSGQSKGNTTRRQDSSSNDRKNTKPPPSSKKSSKKEDKYDSDSDGYYSG